MVYGQFGTGEVFCMIYMHVATRVGPLLWVLGQMARMHQPADPWPCQVSQISYLRLNIH